MNCSNPSNRGLLALFMLAFPIFLAVMFGTDLASSSQTLYHWTDSEGVTHFSDNPPPEEAWLIKKFKGEEARKTSVSPKSEKDRTQTGLGRFTVTHVFDGDSFEAKGHSLTVEVRLAGIDAPEIGKKDSWGQPFSRRAKNFLAKSIENRVVFLKGYGSDSYNRQLAEVFLDGKNIGLKLVEAGLAETYSGIPPDGFDAAPYRKAEIRARKAGLGIWSLGDTYESPYRWRRRMR